MIRERWIKFLTVSAGVLALAVMSAWGESAAISGVQKASDGVMLTSPAGVTRLQVWSDRVVRVTFAPGKKLPEQKSLCVVGRPAKAKWSLAVMPDAVTLQTAALRARVDRKTGAVGFSDLQGNPILQESENGREFAASPVTNIVATSVKQSFVLAPDEHIYGLGQHQGGVWNYRGTIVRLQQRNMEVGVPVLVSSKGYGVLWDNPAVTDIDAGKRTRVFCRGLRRWARRWIIISCSARRWTV